MTIARIGMKSIQYGVGVAALLLALSGCTSTVSRNISDEGVPEEVVFPDKDDAWNEKGSFPGVSNLQSIGPGMEKHAIYQLIGAPHFSERLGAREWDYIFNFRDDQHQIVKQCQYKIVFDDNRLARSFYWLPKECGKDFFQSKKPDNDQKAAKK